MDLIFEAKNLDRPAERKPSVGDRTPFLLLEEGSMLVENVKVGPVEVKDLGDVVVPPNKP